jgi:4-amino-4-deoxy-L-arabinose transferase-like glycosyltransferase
VRGASRIGRQDPPVGSPAGPADGPTPRTAVLALAGLVGGYLAIEVAGLGVAPIVHQDEPWQASSAWSIVTNGRFASDVFAGLHGAEVHQYAFPPVHPLLQAIVQAAAGPGLVQARAETVALGALILVLAYLLGRRVAGPWVGVGAVALLLLVQTSEVTTHHLTGIPLLDVARVARYDIAVPAFGLAALLAAMPSGAGGRSGRRLVLAGALGGLSTLAHLYGAFWLAAVAIVLALEPGSPAVRARRVGLLAAGSAVVAIPYLAFVASGFDDFRAQVAGYGPRFQLLDPGWYVDNLLAEAARYAPGGGFPFRPGAILAAVATPLAIGYLVARARRGDGAAAAVAVPAILIPAALALLVSTKTSAYLIAVLPVWAVAVACAGAALVRTRVRARPLVLALAVLVAVEGIGRVAALREAIATTTPYADFAAQLRGSTPAGARVLSLHDDWFAFVDTDLRSWLVPIVLADPAAGDDAVSIEAGLDAFDPDVVVIGPGIRAFLEGAAPSDPRPAAILDWLASRGYRLERTVQDASYGRFEVYRVTDASR